MIPTTITTDDSIGIIYTTVIQFVYLMEGDEGIYTCTLTIDGDLQESAFNLETISKYELLHNTNSMFSLRIRSYIRTCIRTYIHNYIYTSMAGVRYVHVYINTYVHMVQISHDLNSTYMHAPHIHSIEKITTSNFAACE